MKTNLTRLTILLLLSLTTLPTHAQWSGTGDIYYNNGNVGIGTSSPGTKLDIRHGQSGGLSIKRIGMSSTIGKGLYLTGGGYVQDADWGGIAAGISSDLGTYTARSDAASSIEFKNGHIYFKAVDGLTDGTFQVSFPARLIIKPDGNIGIGTSSPDRTLVVKSSNFAESSGGVHFVHSNGTQGIEFGYAGLKKTTNNGYGNLSIDAADNDNLLFQTQNSGNVGIGTSDPLDKLQVSGNLRLDGSYSNDEIRFESQNGFHRIAFRELRLYDWDAGGDNLTINNGNVGIGITNPQSKLHINNGDNSFAAILANATESNFSLYTKTITTQPVNVESFRLGLKYGSDENNGFISFYRGGGTSGGFLGFSTDGNERIRISSNGNIGIGTTSPDNKLDVKGTIRAEEVKVETGWADYVFYEDYKLKSLSEVSTYIQENHHLPGIPTAEEVAENGIKLGEMNAKLLEKVEELTLYLIEMKEENEQQQKEIEILKSKVK